LSFCHHSDKLRQVVCLLMGRNRQDSSLFMDMVRQVVCSLFARFRQVICSFTG
jgi:hypothetical protein